MKETEKQGIIDGVVGQLKVKVDEPAATCKQCSGTIRCPHLETYGDAGEPRRCFLLRHRGGHGLCVLEHSSRCGIWNRIKREWQDKGIIR